MGSTGGITMETATEPYNILLAEDSAMDVEIVREALNKENLRHILHAATDGAEAIDFIRQIDKTRKAPRLDLLLVDMYLPRYDGEEILKCLRSTEHFAQTPAVVISASDRQADYERAQRQAAVAYFHKTSSAGDFIELGEIVQKIL